MKKIKWIILGLTFLGLIGCSLLGHRSSRYPASGAEPTGRIDHLFDEVKIFKDFLRINNEEQIVDTYNKRYRYRVQVNRETNLDEKEIFSRYHRAVHDAIENLKKGAKGGKKGEGASDTYMKKFQKALVSALIDAFKNPSGIYQFLNKDINIDLHVMPEKEHPISADNSNDRKVFENELNNNMLINYTRKGSLGAMVKKSMDLPVQEILYGSAPFEAEHRPRGEPYEFIGGLIRIHIKTLDLNWNPLKVPKPKDNAVKGHIMIRRYFAVTDGFSEIKGGNYQLKFQREERREHNNTSIVAVDLYKNFNINQRQPKRERLDILFGELSHNKKGSKNFGYLEVYKNNQYEGRIAKLSYLFKRKGKNGEVKTKAQWDLKKTIIEKKHGRENKRMKFLLKKRMMKNFDARVLKELELNEILDNFENPEFH